MPGLARILEASGFSTIFVTMMPFWAERVGTPRTLAVEFPFAQTLGRPNNTAQQMGIIRQSLEVLENATQAGTIIHSPQKWPQSTSEATKAWQPSEPSPVIRTLVPHIRSLLRQRRKKTTPQSDQYSKQ